MICHRSWASIFFKCLVSLQKVFNACVEKNAGCAWIEIPAQFLWYELRIRDLRFRQIQRGAWRNVLNIFGIHGIFRRTSSQPLIYFWERKRGREEGRALEVRIHSFFKAPITTMLCTYEYLTILFFWFQTASFPLAPADDVKRARNPGRPSYVSEYCAHAHTLAATCPCMQTWAS